MFPFVVGQVERLEEREPQLAEQYEQVQKQYAEWVKWTTILGQDYQKMSAHVTKLTDAYDTLTGDLREFLR